MIPSALDILEKTERKPEAFGFLLRNPRLKEQPLSERALQWWKERERDKGHAAPVQASLGN